MLYYNTFANVHNYHLANISSGQRGQRVPGQRVLGNPVTRDESHCQTQKRSFCPFAKATGIMFVGAKRFTKGEREGEGERESGLCQGAYQRHVGEKGRALTGAMRMSLI